MKLNLSLFTRLIGWLAASRNHRMIGWLFASLLLMAIMALSYGQLRAVFGFKTLLVIWGAYLGYWVARGVLRDYRPDMFLEEVHIHSLQAESIVRQLPPDMPCALAFAAAVLGRVIIVAAVVFGLALGA